MTVPVVRISQPATEEARVRNAQGLNAAAAVSTGPSRSAAQAASGPQRTDLSERDREILAFERQWWRHVGAKEEAIRSELGLSSARYYQVLGALIDHPGALVHDPMLVNRLHRMREVRAESRARRSINADSSQPTTLPRTESD